MDTPIVIVGNKADLVPGRSATSDCIKEFTRSSKIPYFETSAKEGKSLNEFFQSTFELAT